MVAIWSYYNILSRNAFWFWMFKVTIVNSFFLSKHELLWQKKIEIHIECHPLRKIKVVFKATTPISDLVTWSIMPSLPSSMWENRAIHIFKRIFFKVYHQVFIFCIYIQPHFALPVIAAGITQCFYSWWLLDCTV